ncbi:MAG: imidazole glycerol phosphate synthase subunit HisH [Solirubrobacterales bacterium]|nr:MAG: imidazole glycerol phosphate synthase subunit HisH [Solirubrobacterales bacterium]
MGNRRSVEKALDHVGASARITRDHGELRAADGLVVPGVGAFPRAMANLRELGLDDVIAERAAQGIPVLGICLGMQLLFERSSERGGAEGLALLAGEVAALRPGAGKLPHIGWNLVSWRAESRLTGGLPETCAFYHVHSFVARPADEDDVLGMCQYGERFATAVARPPLYGVQFHPEKSSLHGLRLLENFASVCAPTGSRVAVRA